MKPDTDQPPASGLPVNVFTVGAEATTVESLRAQLADHQDQRLRLAADFENFKRRTREEGEARARAQKESFIEELLPVLDNLDRALASGGSAQLHQGVEMTVRQLRQLLRLHGIESEEGVGQPFDPRRQEAVSQRHDPAQPDHSVLEVCQQGYRRGDKVFRPAKVVVNVLPRWTQSCHAR